MGPHGWGHLCPLQSVLLGALPHGEPWNPNDTSDTLINTSVGSNFPHSSRSACFGNSPQMANII